MRSNSRWIITLVFLAAVSFILWRAFPLVARFVAMAAMEIRYFWWLILAIAFGAYLWALQRKRR